MTNDAKLGLVLGVAIVLVIALVFFRHEELVAKMPADQGRVTTVLKKDAPAARSPSTQISAHKSVDYKDLAHEAHP